jgi:hypothetical protein
MKGNDKDKITILFLSANPRGTKKLDLIKESNAIEDIIDSAVVGDQFLFKQRHEASVSRLQQYLIKYKPQIVHFAGHGNDETETGIFLFQDLKGKNTRFFAYDNLLRLVKVKDYDNSSFNLIDLSKFASTNVNTTNDIFTQTDVDSLIYALESRGAFSK